MDKIVIIVGKRGNLSNCLSKSFKNSLLISTDELISKKFNLNKYNKKKIYLIINSFYPSKKLNKIINENEFIDKSILNLTNILELFKKFNIIKIIYTSSSSVYNLKKISLFKSSDSHRDFYALTKFLCEKIIIKYAKKQQISYLITRLFNVYGGDDNFSIISKIINCYNSKSIFHLNNNGESIRDFIHIDDVTRIYKKIINNKKKNQILDIGKGYGYKIKDIIYELGIKKFNLKYKFLPEEKVSISKLNLSKELNLSEIKKLSLSGYLSAKLKLKNRIKLKKISYDGKLNLNHEISGAIIYGAGNAGKQVCDLILKKNLNGVYCLIDDDEKKIGKFYKNKPIISKISLEKISNSTVIPNIIIAIPSLNNEKLQKLFNYLYNLSSTVYNLPLKSEMNIHQINLGDLQKSEFSKIFKRKSFLCIIIPPDNHSCSFIPFFLFSSA